VLHIANVYILQNFVETIIEKKHKNDEFIEQLFSTDERTEEDSFRDS
jgi:hypothetical protein